MKRNWTKRAACIGLAAAMTAAALAGCGSSSSSSSDSESANTSGYDEFITVDVFDSQANFQGIQTGWFAKIVKEKFNMELNIIAPNVAGGGDTLYQTRSANGNLGDLIITNADASRLKDMVEAGLIYDMSDLIGDEEYLMAYKEAIDSCSALAEENGVWAVPSEVSTQSATDPCDATEPTNAASLRWDAYAAVGYPTIDDLDGLLDVLEEMQNAVSESDSGKQTYALSLFSDWDGDLMQNADGIYGLYGYTNMGFALGKSDGSDVQSVLDEDGIYWQTLKFFYEANQRGLLDSESTTQNYDTLASKYKDGQILYSLWPWLGSSQYNTDENTSEGKGFATAIIEDSECSTYGSMPYGKTSCAIMVGSSAQDPERMVDFVNWLYSPEGIQCSGVGSSSTAGPEGLAWEIVDGEPAFTDYGITVLVNKQTDEQVPEEWGTGSWEDGMSALNYKAVGLVDVDESTGICYNYQKWEDYEEKTATALTEDWSAHNDGAAYGIEALENAGKLLVIPGSNYSTPEYSTDISTIKEQCKQTIVDYSWKMVYASGDSEFDSLFQEMIRTAKGLGFDDVYAVDEQNFKDKFAAQAESVAASNAAAE